MLSAKRKTSPKGVFLFVALTDVSAAFDHHHLYDQTLPSSKPIAREGRGGRGKPEAAGIDVGLTDQTLSCTARAHVPKPERRAARLHVRRALRAA